MKIADLVTTGPAQRVRALYQGLTQIKDDPAREQPAPAFAGTLTNSPLFGTLLTQLRTVERCCVLDLGPAVGANVEFFGQLHCKLHIADCGMALAHLNDAVGETEGERPFAALLKSMLPLDRLEPVDAILAWDLLNYLDKPLFAALMEHLSPIISGDTWLHAYIGSRREMAAQPNHYRLTLEGRVAVAARDAATRTCPCYHQLDLRSLMPGFKVARSTLLQNGMQEYLFQGDGRGHRVPLGGRAAR